MRRQTEPVTAQRLARLLLPLLALTLSPLPPGASPREGAAEEAPPAAPAEEAPTIRIVGAARPRIPIAIPDLKTNGRGARLLNAAAEVREVVRDDLDYSGYFHIVPEEYHRLVRKWSDRRLNFKEWLGIGAEALLVGKLGIDGSNLVLEGRVYDTAEQRMVVGKRYRGRPEVQRLIAHRLSDEIILQYSGEQGVATTKIAYVSQVGRAKEIFIMDYDGARQKRITGNGSINLSPAWSPDGREIAFLSYKSGEPELLILNQEGELRRAFPQRGELNSAPAWSPDGRLVALASSRDGNAEIYTLRVADGRLTRLTRNPAIDTSPAWSPTGREIAFTSDRAGSPQIYIMDAEGANVRRLTLELAYCDAASWSPRGDEIVFTARVPGGFDIFVKNLKTGELRQLTRDSNINEWPRWSPDGRHIVFASNRTGNFDVYTMTADGRRVRRLTRGGNSFSPSWSR
ncbi:MAG: Tol-Pal system beta propeller repeat protein TolB [Acidobacteriota bacterium]